MDRSDLAARRRNWIWRMRRFSRCRLTVAEFCEQERVSVAAFYQWRKKLAQNGPFSAGLRSASPHPVPATPPVLSRSFIPVRLLQPAVIEVRLVNGVRLSLPTGDLEVLRQALNLVSRLPAKSPSSTEDESC